MAFPKVKLSDDSGNAVGVTSNALDVNIAGGATIDIGDVDMFLDGGVALLGNAGAVAAGVLRVTLASDDPAVAALQIIDDWDAVHDSAVPSDGVMMMGEAKDVDGSWLPNSISHEGDAIRMALSPMGVQISTLTSSYGHPAIFAEDAEHSSGAFGIMPLAVRNDTLAALAGTDGDYAPLQVNDDGALYVDSSSVVAQVSGLASAIKPQGLTFSGSTNTIVMGALRNDVLEIMTSVADHDYSGLQINAVGALYVDGSDIENAAVQGNPSLIGGRYDSSARTLGDGDAGAVALNASGHVLSELSASTAAIGKLAANSGVDIGDVDVTSMPADTFVAEDGALGKGVLMQADDGSDRKNLQITGLGYLKTHLQTVAYGDASASSPFKADKNAYTEADIGVSAKAKRSDVLANLTNVADDDWTSLQVCDTGALYTTHGVTGGADGVTTDDTSGTVLGGDVACKKVDIQAQTDNTGVVAVGFTGVDSTVATGTGILLNAGDIYSLEINNLNLIYIEASVNAEGVRFTYFT